jgi:LysR family pca operon transcriptional activator
MKIDPRQLANLLSVAEHGSFNRAAAAQGLSQPALSNSIAQLERKLGVKVLDRGRRGSQLNDIGRILARNARTIDHVLRQAAEEVRHRRMGVEGPLRIGCAPSLALKFLPAVLSRFLDGCSGIAVTVIEGLDDELLPALQSGDLELVLGPLAGVLPGPVDIVEHPLFEDRFGVCVGPRHILRSRKTVALAELGNCRWILPLPGNAYRRHVEALFMTQGIPWPENCLTTSSLGLIESIVSQSDFVTIATELQTSTQNPWRLRLVPLKGAGQRTVGLKWRKAGDLSDSAAKFVQIARDAVRAGRRDDRRRGARR